MEHHSSPEILDATIEAARTMLAGAPDDGAAYQGFDRALADKLPEHSSAEGIIAEAARHLQDTLAPRWMIVIDELRSRLQSATWLDDQERHSILRRTRVVMRSELRRAAKQTPGDDDLFLRTAPGGEWATWTQHLLTRFTPPPPLAAVEPGHAHPPLSDEHYEALRQGNVELFSELTERMRPTLMSIARDHGFGPDQREDIVAAAIAKAQRRVSTIRAENTHQFYGWLKTITRNEAIDEVEREIAERDTVERLETQYEEHQHKEMSDTLGEDPERTADPVDPALLRSVIDDAINNYLAPPPAGIDGTALGETGSELAEHLVSPALATRTKKVAEAHRIIVVATIHLLRSLSTPTTPRAVGEHSDRKASTPVRTSIQYALGRVGGRAPVAEASAKEKNTGAESHAARRLAPHVVFAAQRVLRAWLDDKANAARANAAVMQVWRHVWLIERQQLIAQLDAISEQFAGTPSTLSVLGSSHLIALEHWASELLDDLSWILELPPGQRSDDARSEAREPELEATVHDVIMNTFERSVERFEKPSKSDNSGIDAHHRNLAKLERSESPDEKKHQCLNLAISHYAKLRDAYDAHRYPNLTASQQLAADSQELLDPGTASVTRTRQLRKRSLERLSAAREYLTDPAEVERITAVAQHITKEMAAQERPLDEPDTAENPGSLVNGLMASIEADQQADAERELAELRQQHCQDLLHHVRSTDLTEQEPRT